MKRKTEADRLEEMNEGMKKLRIEMFLLVRKVRSKKRRRENEEQEGKVRKIRQLGKTKKERKKETNKEMQK